MINEGRTPSAVIRESQERRVDRHFFGVLCSAVLVALAGCTSSKDTSEPVAPSTVAQSTQRERLDTVVDTAAPTVPSADGSVSVLFDTPGAEARAIKEYMHRIDAPTKRLSMTITGVTYRGIVCGFTFHGSVAPSSPVTIRQRGTKPSGATFDSGPVDVAWTELRDDAVSVSSTEDGDWSFSAAANTNRGAPGWVVSLGGVTPEGDDAVPTRASCELVGIADFLPEHGPVGYWAGYASV